MALIETFDKSLWHRPQSFSDYFVIIIIVVVVVIVLLLINSSLA